MIKVENIEVFGWRAAIRGMRNPMNSWAKSDSYYDKNGDYVLGKLNSETMEKAKVHKMMRDRRIKYYAPADYSDGSELDELINLIRRDKDE